MTEDEVRDYALSLQQEKQAFEQKENEYKSEIESLNGLNKALQKRNNDLFMKVEQQGSADDKKDDPAPPKEEKTETCEDFARRLLNKE